MRLFGWTLTRTKDLAPVGSRGGWLPVIREPFTGAWQQNKEIRPDSVLAYHAVYACITLIAADIGKLRFRLVAKSDRGIWEETASPAFSPVLRKPNRYQNHIQFKEWWMVSKLLRGNAYALIERDNRSVARALYLLDPQRVTPLVADDGAVYYDLGDDKLAGVGTGNLRVPASEVIHDRINCLFHPLVGVSPLYASALAGSAGLAMQQSSDQFFGNNSIPGGILTAPDRITDETAARIKTHWESNYTGANAGRVAVLGDGLKFEPMRMTAVDSQLIEQMRWTSEVICSCFHVPAYMVGVGPAPTYNNIEALAQTYYTQCLQAHIEAMELCLDEGLGLDTPKDGQQLGVDLDLDGLLRMDTSTQVATLKSAVDGTIMVPNEARARLNLPPLPGGDSLWMQQQNYSLEALAERDRNAPFAKPQPAAPAPSGEAANEPSMPPESAVSRRELDALALKFYEARRP